MNVEICEAGPEAIAEFAKIPFRFRVASIYRIEGTGETPGTFRLVEEPVAAPYVKDYDEDEGERPASWPKRYDLTRWAFFIAREGGRPVGAAAVSSDTPGCGMSEGRRDLAVLQDIRVDPVRRGEGIGTALFRRAVEWARERGCKRLRIETQNTNVRACRFYMNQGCRLVSVRRGIYPPPFADEVMLLWNTNL